MIFVYFSRRSRIFVSKKGIYILVNTIPCILIRSRKLIRAEFIDIVLFSTDHLHLPWQAQCWRAPDVVSVVVLIICRSFSRCSINSYIVSLKNIPPHRARVLIGAKVVYVVVNTKIIRVVSVVVPPTPYLSLSCVSLCPSLLAEPYIAANQPHEETDYENPHSNT